MLYFSIQDASPKAGKVSSDIGRVAPHGRIMFGSVLEAPGLGNG